MLLSKKRIRLLIVAIILLIPVWMWLIWLFTPQTKLVAAIIDKTVLTSQGQEHISLTWMFNHYKLTKTSSKPYQLSNDYYGFFPLGNEKFRLKGLERFTAQQLKRLSEDADMVYFTDTYGIYSNEWYAKKNTTERSGIIYGGMSPQDIELLQYMKAKNKLIITEFNSIGSPTAELTRGRFERLFAMRWTGWIGRYFESLDSANRELPRWLINNYKRDNGNKWPFKNSGVAFVSNSDRVVVLEDKSDLEDPLPYILSSAYGQRHFNLPEKMKYTFWFDVIEPDLKVNRQIAGFHLSVNKSGSEILKRNGIPNDFPAVLAHKGPDYRFFYFSGDFCDNPISMTTSYFKGISLFKWLFYNTSDPMERSSFFWNFYRPMMARILSEERSYSTRRNQ